MTIKNITDLRNVALESLEKLTRREIEIEEAQATSLAINTVLETVKTQLSYYKQINQAPAIPFLGNENMLEGEAIRKGLDAPVKKLN